MDDGEELADVVRAAYRTEVEHLLPRGEVNATVFHWSGVAGAGGIHRPCQGVASCCHAYILSGTSMPRSAMPFFIVLAMFAARVRRSCFCSVVSAPSTE